MLTDEQKYELWHIVESGWVGAVEHLKTIDLPSVRLQTGQNMSEDEAFEFIFDMVRQALIQGKAANNYGYDKVVEPAFRRVSL
jgi:hypothetical protein